MAYNPNRIPKGASNQAGFGTPGTAQTRNRRAAGRGYNPNMPVGRQLARHAAGSGAPAGNINWAAGAAQPTYGGETNKQAFTFQDPVETMALKHRNWGAGGDPGAPGISWTTDSMGLPSTPDAYAYYATGQPVEGYEPYRFDPLSAGIPTPGPPGPAPQGAAYQTDYMGNVAQQYAPASPTPLPQPAFVPGEAAMPGVASTPYAPQTAFQPLPGGAEDVVVGQVPESPAGTGYAMLSGMPHEELVGMNRAMGISNISDLRQTQQQLSPFDMVDPGDMQAFEGDEDQGLKTVFDDVGGEEAAEDRGYFEGEGGDVYWDDKTGKWRTKEDWEAAYGEGSWDKSFEYNEEGGWANKYTKKDPDAVAEEGTAADEVLEQKQSKMDEYSEADDPGFHQKQLADDIEYIEGEESEQMANLTDMYMNAYQEQSGALNRQFAMMGMLGSSNHMVANNAIMVQMLDQMAKERTQMGMFYDEKVFGLKADNLKQMEQDYAEYFDEWLKVWTGVESFALQESDLQLKTTIANINAMISFTDNVGGDFFNLLQSFEDLDDATKLKYGSQVNELANEIWKCTGGDISKFDSCSEKFVDSMGGMYDQLSGEDMTGTVCASGYSLVTQPDGSNICEKVGADGSKFYQTPQ